MEKAYNHIYLFFIAIFFVILWGFYRSYIQFFPSFKGFDYAHHLHGFLMTAWLLMLIVQPLLIRAKKLAAHRVIGRCSYLVVPLLLISIFMMGKINYHKSIAALPEQEAIGGIALNIPSILAFGLLYSLAIINRKKARIHMRYMIATSLLMIGPGLGRVMIIYFGVPFPVAVSYTDYFSILIASLLLLSDVLKKKPFRPYAITLGVLLLVHLAWEARLSSFSQAVWGKFAAIFF